MKKLLIDNGDGRYKSWDYLELKSKSDHNKDQKELIYYIST
jgi:hypothetical protein